MSFDLKLTNGDLTLNASKTLDAVFNDDKLRQDLVKVLLTPLGSNKLFPWYGSPLTERAIGKALDLNILNIEMTNSILFSINNLMTLQKDQEKNGQYVSPAEAISKINNVQAQPSIYDPRQINIDVSVSSRRANVVEESFKLRV